MRFPVLLSTDLTQTSITWILQTEHEYHLKEHVTKAGHTTDV